MHVARYGPAGLTRSDTAPQAQHSSIQELDESAIAVVAMNMASCVPKLCGHRLSISGMVTCWKLGTWDRRTPCMLWDRR
jgi:hypothetical protein